MTSKPRAVDLEFLDLLSDVLMEFAAGMRGLKESLIGFSPDDRAQIKRAVHETSSFAARLKPLQEKVQAFPAARGLVRMRKKLVSILLLSAEGLEAMASGLSHGDSARLDEGFNRVLGGVEKLAPLVRSFDRRSPAEHQTPAPSRALPK